MATVTTPGISVAPATDLRAGQERRGGHLGLDDDGRPQEDRHHVHLPRRLLLHRRRHRGAADPRATRDAERQSAHPDAVRPGLHDARHDDDLPFHHPGIRGLRELLHPADDRRAGHGLPPPQCLRLLDASLRRPLPQQQFLPRRRARFRLVRLRPADRAAVQPRPEHGFLGRRSDAARHLLDRRFDQCHRHDAEDALPRLALQPPASLRLDDARPELPSPLRTAEPDDGGDLPALRPPPRHEFLQGGERRRPAPLAASLLGVRPPGGLHPHPARLRHRLGNPARLLAQADLRLHLHRLVVGGDRLPLVRRLGPSHVRDGPAGCCARLLRLLDDADRHPDRREGLQLDGDALGRQHRHEDGRCSSRSAS